MNPDRIYHDRRAPRPPITIYLTALAIAWTVLIACAFLLGASRERKNTYEMALMEARAHLTKDQALRYWTGRRGVYVIADETTQPNPRLAHLAERDVLTPSGRLLTIENPATIMGDILKDYPPAVEIGGTLTSLKPLGRGSAPDTWEKAALGRIMAGEAEVVGVEDASGRPYLRLMQPMTLESECLLCHGPEGEHAGIVRGGAAVAVPLAPLLRLQKATLRTYLAVHGALWALGLGAIALGGGHIRKGIVRLERTADALGLSRESLNRAQRIAHLGNWEWNIPENTLAWSDEIYRIFGLPPEAFEATYEAFLARVHPADRASVEKAVCRAVEDGVPYSIIHRIVRGDGEERIVHEMGEVTFSPGGEPLVMTGTVHDITTMKRAEEEIEHARDFYLKVLDEMPNPIWRAGAAGSIDYFNRAWFTFTGMQRDPALFETWSEGIHPEDRERIRTVLRTAFASREPFETEFRLRHADGSYRYVLDIGVPFSGLNGEFEGYIGSCYDITRHRVIEDRISASLREKELLINEIHHRVNNNMQIIISLLRLHARLICDQGDQKIFLECQTRIRTMALVHDLIYQSRNFAEIDLSAYTKQIVGNLMKTLGISPSRIAVRIGMDQAALGIDTAVPCGMIINELLSNALTHAFPGDREGSVLISLTKPGPGEFLLRVVDDGVGPPEGFSVETASSFGMEMLRTLAAQLGSKVVLRRTDAGTGFEVAFAEIAYRPRL